MASDSSARPIRRRMRLSGWRLTATLNTALIFVILLALVGCLSSSLYRTGGLNRVLVLFNGSCEKSRQINLLLHLATNIISTIILASTNFFMQVLTSPSREEVDRAHAKGRSLDIGVQSLLNFGQLPKRKLISWFLFVLGSLPLHVFANSVIFGTDDGRSGYYAIYATEAFVHGGQYFPLGAALTPDKSTPWADYLNPAGDMSKFIEKAAKEAAGWQRLDVEACTARYLGGRPIYDHQDVVMIVDSNGWTTNDLWNFTSDQTETTVAYVPIDQLNTLLSTQRGETNENLAPVFLSSSSPTNLSVSLGSPSERLLHNQEFDFFGEKTDWGYTSTNYVSLLRQSPAPVYPVRYCLSQPLASNCKVAISLPILLIVVITTLIKLSQCAVVLLTFRHENPLVTLGDAIESFLDKQDEWTRGCCTYGWRDFRSSAIHRRVVEAGAGNGARQWKKTRHRWSSAVRTWLQVVYYAVMLGAIAGAAFLYYMALQSRTSVGVFGPGATNPILAEGQLPHGSVVISSLIANSPQVVLSICYLCYNTLFTRFLLAQEWGSMSTAFRGLRVTEPKGEQTSTFWLQLPLPYALPLMAASTLLHWLVSSSLYMMVGEGEWYEHIRNRTGASSNTASSDMPGAFIGVGYSPSALRIILIISPILLAISLLMGLFCRIPGTTTLVGSDSRAISAGCHISGGSGEAEELLSKSAHRSDVVQIDEDGDNKLSAKKLKWGAVGSEGLLRRRHRPDGLQVEHLGFQSEDAEVTEPVDGRWYA